MQDEYRSRKIWEFARNLGVVAFISACWLGFIFGVGWLFVKAVELCLNPNSNQ